MKRNQKRFIQNFLANMHLNISVAAYTKVSKNWQDLNFIPEFNRFYLITEGEGWVKIGDQEYYPQPGQLFVLPADILQSYSVTDGPTFTKYWCHFTSTIGDLKLFQVLDLPHFIQVKDIDYIKNQFQKLIDYHKSDELTATIRAKAVLMELICYFIEHNQVNHIDVGDSSSIEKINHVLIYIENHLTEEITVRELAQIVHFHPNYFIRFFKDVMGVSPIHYINHLRMERAKQLLLSTDQSISEISSSLGLELYYFSRIFKNHTGFSPTEFRQEVNRH